MDRCAANALPHWLLSGIVWFSLPLAVRSHLIYAGERKEKYEGASFQASDASDCRPSCGFERKAYFHYAAGEQDMKAQ
jgi:hypothetical protein